MAVHMPAGRGGGVGVGFHADDAGTAAEFLGLAVIGGGLLGEHGFVLFGG